MTSLNHLYFLELVFCAHEGEWHLLKLLGVVMFSDFFPGDMPCFSE
jgi:hypothetical protein